MIYIYKWNVSKAACKFIYEEKEIVQPEMFTMNNFNKSLIRVSFMTRHFQG